MNKKEPKDYWKETQEYWKKILNKIEITKSTKFDFMEPKEKQEIKEGGFFDLEKIETCLDKEHKPPMYIHIPPGKGYRHICPTCKKETILIPPQISF